MITNYADRLLHLRSVLVGLTLVAIGFQPVAAQDTKADDNVYTIEIRDGDLYLNGEFVEEIEGDDRAIVFRQNGNGDVMVLRRDLEDSFLGSSNLFTRLNMDKVGNAQFKARQKGGKLEYLFDGFDGEPRRFDSRFQPLMEGIMSQHRADFLSEDTVAFEIMRMEREARSLAARIERSDGDTSDLENELDEKLADIFDKKLEAREERMETLEEQLEKLRGLIEQRRSDRAEIIQQRKDELLGRGARYEW